MVRNPSDELLKKILKEPLTPRSISGHFKPNVSTNQKINLLKYLPATFLGVGSATIPFLGQESNTNSNVYKKGGSIPKYQMGDSFNYLNNKNSKSKKIPTTDLEKYLDLKEKLLNKEVPYINLGLPENNYKPSNIYKYAFAEPSPEGFFGLATLGSNELGLQGTIGGYLPYDIRTNPYFKGDYFANVQKHFPKLSVGVGANKAIFGYPDQSGNFTREPSGITPNFNLKFNLKHGGRTEDPPLTAMMKARLAYANEFGNPAAQRMITLPDNLYDFGDGNMGSHYMASMDNYAVPQIQDVNGKLVFGNFGPESNEAIRFDRNEDADYFAKHYKEVSPAFNNFQKGGSIPKYQKGNQKYNIQKPTFQYYEKPLDVEVIDNQRELNPVIDNIKFKQQAEQTKRRVEAINDLNFWKQQLPEEDYKI